MSGSSTRTIEVQHQAHIALARRVAVDLAGELGFDHIATGEIAIAVTELATNLIKHGAKDGKIISSIMEGHGRKGIEIVSVDSGPGIADVDLAIEDGFSTCGTMGGGLGAVNRLMDEFCITSNVADTPDAAPLQIGTRVECRKWLPRHVLQRSEGKTLSGASSQAKLSFAVMLRPMPGEQCSGDAYFLKHYEGIHFIAVIDGLGHGEKANIAAETAVGFIRDNYRKSLEQIFQGVHRVCGKTQGAVMSICRIDLVNKTLSYAGVGNVVARIFDSPEPIHPTNYNGTLGLVMRKVRVFEYPWRGGIIVMYTDGISGRWSFNDFPELKSRPPVEIATALLERFGRANDDATVIVGK
jgi:anti-sigma regulatory factor (Ser/Thr protein kinase)